MKIYTRTGDDGSTGLIGGERVRKSDPRIDCTGGVDELNATIGLAQVEASRGSPPRAGLVIAAGIRAVQNDLFVLGAHLATPDESLTGGLPPLDDSMIGRLEMQIDAAESELPALRQFILPGGSELAARLHVARTVCRRIERRVAAFALDRPVEGLILTYLNRLADWLFVYARLANHIAGVEDVPWEK